MSRSARLVEGHLSTRVETSGNGLTADIDPGHMCLTLDEVIDIAKIDTDVWEPDYFRTGAFNTTLKDDEGNPVTVPNWQIKVKFVRKEPIAVNPVVRPLKVPHFKLKKTKNRPARDMRLAVVLPDPQMGFWLNGQKLDITHDRRALDLVVQVVRAIEPDDIIIMGDWADLADWSDKFVRRPEFAGLTQAMVIESYYWLAQLRKAAPYARILFLEGNHEARMERYLLTHFRQAYDLRPADRLDRPPPLSLPGLLALDSLGVEYLGPYPDGRVWLNNDLVVRHGDTVRGGSGATVKAVLSSAEVSTIHGHIHRREMASKTVHRPRRIGGGEEITCVSVYSPGATCRIDGVVPARAKRNQWQQGFAVVYYTDVMHEVRILPIENGKTFWDGAILTGDNTATPSLNALLEEETGRAVSPSLR